MLVVYVTVQTFSSHAAYTQVSSAQDLFNVLHCILPHCILIYAMLFHMLLVSCHFNVHLAPSPLGQKVQCHQMEGESHAGGIIVCHNPDLLFPCSLHVGALYMFNMLHCMLIHIVCISSVIIMYAVATWCVGCQIKGFKCHQTEGESCAVGDISQPRTFVPMWLTPRVPGVISP